MWQSVVIPRNLKLVLLPAPIQFHKQNDSNIIDLNMQMQNHNLSRSNRNFNQGQRNVNQNQSANDHDRYRYSLSYNNKFQGRSGQTNSIDNHSSINAQPNFSHSDPKQARTVIVSY